MAFAALFHPASKEAPRLIWIKIAIVLLCGYDLFGRTFAYVGIPSAKLFIGDITLALFLVFCTGAVVRPWLAALLSPTPFSALCWSLLTFTAYGLLELYRGLMAGYPPLTALQDLVFNIYPLYLFLGIWTAVRIPGIVPKIIHFVVWTSTIYGIAYFLLLRHIRGTLPGTNAELIVAPGGGLAFLGLTYLGKDWRKNWFVMIPSAFFVLAGQIRAEWLSLMGAMALQAILTRKVRLFCGSVGLVGALLLIGYWADISIPSPEGRGGAIATREIVARAIASADYEAALEYSRKNAAAYHGTTLWRRNWWRSIWSTVHAGSETTLLGFGYGYPLHKLVPYLRRESLRTPHNIFYYALAYSGWIGVFLFASFQGALALTLFRVWRVTGQPFGIVVWLAGIITSLFGELFETPAGAIPFYLTLGMVAAGLNASLSVEKPIIRMQRALSPKWQRPYAASGKAGSFR